VLVGSKNEFDLKHYIDDLFFQIGGGGSDPIWKIPNIFVFCLFLNPSLRLYE
jgi:hypothetical protein